MRGADALQREPIRATQAAEDASADSTAENEAIRITDLHKSFGALEVLKGVSLTCLLYTSDAADE